MFAPGRERPDTTRQASSQLPQSATQGSSSVASGPTNPDENWTKVSDAAERRRISNRIAQRSYREKLKNRLKDLERRDGSESDNKDAAVSEDLLEVQPSLSEGNIGDDNKSSIGPSIVLPLLRREPLPNVENEPHKDRSHEDDANAATTNRLDNPAHPSLWSKSKPVPDTGHSKNPIDSLHSTNSRERRASSRAASNVLSHTTLCVVIAVGIIAFLTAIYQTLLAASTFHHAFHDELQEQPGLSKVVFRLPSSVWAYVVSPLTVVLLWSVSHFFRWLLPASARRQIDELISRVILNVEIRRRSTWVAQEPNSWRRLRKFFHSPVAPGYERLEWTCECGKSMFGDFKSPSLELKRQLAAMSRAWHDNAQSGSTSQSDSTQPLSPPAQARTRTSNRRQPVGWTSTPYSPPPPISRGDGGSSTASQVPPQPQQGLWIQVCVKAGRWRTTAKLVLYEQSPSDGDIFRTIKRRYEEARPSFLPLSWRLVQPIKAVFIKFRYEEAPFMSRLSGTDDLPAIPPVEEVMVRRYEYQPCPLDEPPMTSDHFIHYLYATSEHKARVWGPRLPKKYLQEGQRLGSFTENWGIQIYEGLNWTMVTGLALFIVVLSGLVAGIVWWKTEDPQTAVAIGTWLTTVQALALSLMYFVWS